MERTPWRRTVEGEEPGQGGGVGGLPRGLQEKS